MFFKFKKSFGQNFLRNETLLSKMVLAAEVSKNDDILEIGPGDGALTSHLLNKCGNLIAIEKDISLESILRKKFSHFTNFYLIIGDVLNIDIKEIGAKKKLKIVANIPYYITTPLIKKFLDNSDLIDDIYITIQKEVAERITSRHGSKNYGLLTLFVNYYAETKILLNLPRGAFFPIPDVDSSFLKIKLRKFRFFEKIEDENLFFECAKAAFGKRRKNIINNLIELGVSKGELIEAFKSKNINPDSRAEDFSLEEFVDIAMLIKDIKKV